MFLASNECYISDKYKELVLKATDISTVVTGRPSGHPVRSLKTPMARKCLELEKQNTNASLEELEKATAGSLRKAVQDGNYEEGTFMSGQIAGMVKDVPACKDLMARLMAGMPSVGEGYEFDAITAVIVGGTSFLGGIGTVTGALIGSIIVGLINNILNLLHVSTQYQLIVKGLLIAIAVIIDIKTKENKKSK